MSDNTTATSLSSTSTYYKIAGTTTAGNQQRFTASNNRLTYIGKLQMTGKVIAIIGAKSPTANGDFTIVLAKNGTPISNPTGSMAPSVNNQSFQITLVKEGHSSKEISEQLHIGSRTVEVHRYTMLKKLNLKNTAALINFINNTDLNFV